MPYYTSGDRYFEADDVNAAVKIAAESRGRGLWSLFEERRELEVGDKVLVSFGIVTVRSVEQTPTADGFMGFWYTDFYGGHTYRSRVQSWWVLVYKHEGAGTGRVPQGCQ